MSSDSTIQEIFKTILTNTNISKRVFISGKDAKLLFDFWSKEENQGFRDMLDETADFKNNKPSEIAKSEMNKDILNKQLVVNSFVNRTLIPRIIDASVSRNLKIKRLWEQFVPKEPDIFTTSHFSSARFGTEFGPEFDTEFGPEINELNVSTSNPNNELKYKYDFLKALIERMNEGGNQFIEGMSEEGDQVIETTANMLNQFIILFFQLAINSALILKLIQETEVNSFQSADFKGKFNTIIMVIFRIINNLLEVSGLKSAVISVSKKIFNMFLCFVIVCIMIKTGIGAYLIKLIFNGFLIILNYFFSDVYDKYFQYIKKLLTDKIFITIDDLITNYFINFFKNKLLNGEFLEWFKTTVRDITGPLIQGGVESLTDTIAKTSETTLAAIAQSGETTLEEIAKNGQLIHAAIETSGQATLTAIKTSDITLIKPFFGKVVERLALVAAVSSNNPTVNFDNFLAAFKNTDPTQDDNKEIDEILKSLLHRSNFDPESIFQGRLSQLDEQIVQKVIARLGEQGDPSIINNVLNNLFQLLSNAAFSGITAAISPTLREITFYGGKKGKNKKSKTINKKTKPKRKTKKIKNKRKTKKMKNKRRARKIKKSKKI